MNQLNEFFSSNVCVTNRIHRLLAIRSIQNTEPHMYLLASKHRELVVEQQLHHPTANPCITPLCSCNTMEGLDDRLTSLLIAEQNAEVDILSERIHRPNNLTINLLAQQNHTLLSWKEEECGTHVPQR